jgi:hypothetical protein
MFSIFPRLCNILHFIVAYSYYDGNKSYSALPWS